MRSGLVVTALARLELDEACQRSGRRRRDARSSARPEATTSARLNEARRTRSSPAAAAQRPRSARRARRLRTAAARRARTARGRSASTSASSDRRPGTLPRRRFRRSRPSACAFERGRDPLELRAERLLVLGQPVAHGSVTVGSEKLPPSTSSRLSAPSTWTRTRYVPAGHRRTGNTTVGESAVSGWPGTCRRRGRSRSAR